MRALHGCPSRLLLRGGGLTCAARAAPLRLASTRPREAPPPPPPAAPHPAVAASMRRVEREVRSLCDLRHPHTWYRAARRMRRTVHLHVGPTNSGKTHAALQALKAARSGVYCGPLRLLAWELYERLNAEGTPCSLLTGQEREEVEGAAHVSCTVEMVDVEASGGVGVGVLDEIQMIGDPDRGWAWSRVLLGLPAPQLHACGDPSAVPLVRSLLALTGDELVVHEYTRLSPLEVERAPLPGLSAVRRGDCVVAFSRRELFRVKRDVESTTGLRCGVIYGALPPQVRREQARRFNAHADARGAHPGGAAPLSDAPEPVDVLVATDAVGMGLNLAIRRVVFSRLDKFDGTARRPLTVSEMKQIGGRAGRFGSAFPVGAVGALRRQHLGALATALRAPTPELTSAGVLPQLEQLEQFAAALVGLPDDSDDDDDSGGDDVDSEGDGVAAGPHDRGGRVVDDPDADVAAMLSANAHLRGGRYPSPLPGDDAALDAPGSDTASDSEDDDDDDGELDAIVDGRLRSHASRAVRRRADAALATLPFTALLEGFLSFARVNAGLYHLCDTEDLLSISRALDGVPGLPFRVRYAWCLAPVDVDDPLVLTAIKRYARKFVEKGRVRVGLRVPTAPPRTPGELAELESAHSVFDLYLWLGRRYPAEFTQVPEASAAALATQQLIQQGLEALGDAALAEGARRRGKARRRAGADSGAAALDDDDALLDALDSEEEEEGDSGEDARDGAATAGGRWGAGHGGARGGLFARLERNGSKRGSREGAGWAGSYRPSEFARSMDVDDEGEGDDDGGEGGRAWALGGGGSRAAKTAAKERARAKKQARRAGRQAERHALALLEDAFSHGGLRQVRTLQQDAAWQAAMQDALDARMGAAAMRGGKPGKGGKGSRPGGGEAASSPSRHPRGGSLGGEPPWPRGAAGSTRGHHPGRAPDAW